MGTRLAGKAAIITGATLGLGKAAALLFAREGASVVVCDRGRMPENGEAVLREAQGLSGEIAYRKCDVMIRDDITDLVQFTLQRYGRVDVMVNNAIIDNPGGSIEEVRLQDWEEGIFCHMTAPFLFCQQVIPAMIRQGGGSIVNVSSNTALFGNTGISSYGPAKAGMISFSKHLAVACGPHGIRVQFRYPRRACSPRRSSPCSTTTRPRCAASSTSIRSAARPCPSRWPRCCCFSPPTRRRPSPATTWSPIAAQAATNSAATVQRLETDLRRRLQAQGSDWIAAER